jgi:hypothetical protein
VSAPFSVADWVMIAIIGVCVAGNVWLFIKALREGRL